MIGKYKVFGAVLLYAGAAITEFHTKAAVPRMAKIRRMNLLFFMVFLTNRSIARFAPGGKPPVYL